jgi:uncharacterized membrane protein
MSKVIPGVIFLILVIIGMAALTGLLSPGAMMGEVMSAVTGGVLLGLIAVFVIFD